MSKLYETHKIINAGPPKDINGAGLDGAYVSLKNYDHLTAIVQLGVTGASCNITVEKDANGTGAGTAITFTYRKEDTDSGETLDAAATSASLATSTNNNIFYVIEVDAAEIGPDYPYIRVRLSDPGAATLTNIIYILSGARYQGQSMPVALA